MRNQLCYFFIIYMKNTSQKIKTDKILATHPTCNLHLCYMENAPIFSQSDAQIFLCILSRAKLPFTSYVHAAYLVSTWNHLLNILYTYIPDVMERYSSEDEAPSITFSNWQKEIKHSIYHRNMMMKYCLSLEFFWVIIHVNKRTKYLTPRANKVVLCYWLHRVHMCHT